MPGVQARADACPDADEIRTALEHMATSEAFRGSPQLVSFLRYVVEATLRGAADRIKGYTIAVEALGRAADFDPQADPIVRVEAMRLRRALNRYYTNGGRRDSVVIDLPIGSYVPAFRRNDELAVAQLPPADQVSTPPPRAPPRSLRLAFGAALMLAGAAVYAGLNFWFDFWFDFNPQIAPAIVQSRASGFARPLSVYPVVYVGAFQALGDGGATQPVADRLRAKLRDALARFDELAIIGGPNVEVERRGAFPADGLPGRYALTASVEAVGEGAVTVAVRLTDVADGRIAFARSFQPVRKDGYAGSAEELIVREVAVALAQPYGIIYARERAAQMNSTTADPRYRCLIDSYDYWRTYDIAQHARVRDCLERAIEGDPGFAAGLSALAEIILQEHRRGLNPRAGDAPPLERALRAARRAVELRPGSARAYQTLMDVLFLRGDHALALDAGEKAVQLNPYNPHILACYGARLIALGELEKGARLMHEAAAAGAVRPAWHDFFLFLAAYLSDDRRAAASYAAQITSEKFSLGLIARALVAAQQGQVQLAREYFGKLVELQPGWRDDPRREVRKVFPADAVANRLTRDLAQLSGGLSQ
jgi:tetratricopeptide (TPR) repeat protein